MYYLIEIQSMMKLTENPSFERHIHNFWSRCPWAYKLLVSAVFMVYSYLQTLLAGLVLED